MSYLKLEFKFQTEGEGGHVYTVGLIEKGSNLKFEFKFQTRHYWVMYRERKRKAKTLNDS